MKFEGNDPVILMHQYRTKKSDHMRCPKCRRPQVKVTASKSGNHLIAIDFNCQHCKREILVELSTPIPEACN